MREHRAGLARPALLTAYAYRRAAPAAVRAYAPKDQELHRIADAPQAIQRPNFYQLRADIRHRGHHYHAYCMDIAVERDSPSSQDMSGDAEDIVTELLRDLARWLYRQLGRECEYQTSNAVIDAAIIANGSTFTKAGRQFG